MTDDLGPILSPNGKHIGHGDPCRLGDSLIYTARPLDDFRSDYNVILWRRAWLDTLRAGDASVYLLPRRNPSNPTLPGAEVAAACETPWGWMVAYLEYPHGPDPGRNAVIRVALDGSPGTDRIVLRSTIPWLEPRWVEPHDGEDGAYLRGGLAEVALVWDEPRNRVWMYFSGEGDWSEPEGVARRTGVAWSDNRGKTWTVHPDQILVPPASYSSAYGINAVSHVGAALWDGVMHLFTTWSGKVPLDQKGIVEWTSTDGIAFDRVPGFVIPTAPEWNHVGGPCPIERDGERLLLYHAQKRPDETDRHIRLARLV